MLRRGKQGKALWRARGKSWNEFNKDKEAITLKNLIGTVAVTTQY
jgi:hypothetical protein